MPSSHPAIQGASKHKRSAWPLQISQADEYREARRVSGSRGEPTDVRLGGGIRWYPVEDKPLEESLKSPHNDTN